MLELYQGNLPIVSSAPKSLQESLFFGLGKTGGRGLTGGVGRGLLPNEDKIIKVQLIKLQLLLHMSSNKEKINIYA